MVLSNVYILSDGTTLPKGYVCSIDRTDIAKWPEQNILVLQHWIKQIYKESYTASVRLYACF